MIAPLLWQSPNNVILESLPLTFCHQLLAHVLDLSTLSFPILPHSVLPKPLFFLCAIQI